MSRSHRSAVAFVGAATLAGLSSALGATTAGAAQVGADTLLPAPPPITVTCTRSADGSCSVAPTNLIATFPGGPQGATGVNVAWTTAGRPASVPGPAHLAVSLNMHDATCQTDPKSASETCSWPWPQGLEAAGSSVVLNGTYEVTPCSAPATTPTTAIPVTTAPPSSTAPPGTPTTAPPSSTPPAPACTAITGLSPAALGMAVPPASPTNVMATAASSTSSPVTVRWSPGVEPDLAGYTVLRNATSVFSCTVNGASLPGGTSCATPLSFIDHPPGTGYYTYAVTAVRYGVDGTPSHDLSSIPGFAGVSVDSPRTLYTPPARGSIGPLPPVPVLGSPGPLQVIVPGVVGAPPRAGNIARSPATTDPGYGSLPYHTKAGAAAVLHTPGGGQAISGSLSRSALIAAGLLVAAVAAHLLYIRGAVARYSAAHGINPAPAPPVAPPNRASLRVRWAQWPPVVRDSGGLPPPR